MISDPAGPAEQAPAAQARLRDIQLITDGALAALTPQGMLDVLTERVRLALRADTAVLLLRDASAGQLFALASSGLEEEVRQGVRVTVGQGFAGRIAELGRPVILQDVDPASVVNPLLITRGLRSLMGVPLRDADEVIGVLHVGTLTPREFTTDDVDLLQLAADRAAIAVQALTMQIDRAAAVALQRDLLPGALPAIPGLQMAARYVPGSGSVGGDWYDVFRLPGGETCAVIGDVAGSGIKAAAIMGRIRSTLRAYALETSDPAVILSRLDRKIQYFEPGAMATVLCAVISPDLKQAEISCAGHLPPILAPAGGKAAPAEVVSDLLIGVRGARPRRNCAVAIMPGTTLCLYTDGLVERRDRPIDDGIAALTNALSPGPAEAACASLMAAMAPHRSLTDDIAVLLIRHLA
jgi:sigma-B regulation protein RsbU (phosphoserine phosphatase)